MDSKKLSLVLGKPCEIISQKQLCNLWAGYGSIKSLIVKYSDDEAEPLHLILKVVSPPSDSGEAHERKLQSYLVEANFYRFYCEELRNHGIGLAKSYHVAVDETNGKVCILLSDLRQDYSIHGDEGMCWSKSLAAIDWLASFHAYFWQNNAAGNTATTSIGTGTQTNSNSSIILWPEGCYWRLDTRLSEYNSIPLTWQRLKNAANVISDLLKNGTDSTPDLHRTVIHGDYKSSNLQFQEVQQEKIHTEISKEKNNKINTAGSTNTTSSSSGSTSADIENIIQYKCAVVDFQYTGYSYGIRDIVMLFISSIEIPSYSYNYNETLQYEKKILEIYYNKLKENLIKLNKECTYTFERLIQHYELALLDYLRFMLGWGIWGNNSKYAEHRVKEILFKIDEGKILTSSEYKDRFYELYYHK